MKMAPLFHGDADFQDAGSDSVASSTTLNSGHSSVSESSSSLSSFLSAGSLGGSASGRSSASNDVKPVVPLLKPVVSPPGHGAAKPHRANDAAWEAIRAVRCRDGHVGLNHFKLVRRLGSGDIGNVYLCQLRSPSHDLFAMKVVDREALAYRNKLHRAETERQILSTLDHPFLPTLYAHFGASHYSCLVMDFCPRGDLHSLRQSQPGKRFPLQATRFYAAEVLLALEYLHMMGVIFRDLKPENVLVRADGHIMLSDFDLSLKCDVVPTLNGAAKELLVHTRCAGFDPAIWCLFPSSRKSDFKRPEVVVEPTEARSKSFVGTHEYLAPEVISGQGHGSAVDWYTFGIFLFELLYGRTPFKGANNEATLANILTQPLRFPEKPARDTEAWDAARDLVRRLVVKDPRRRLGSSRGAPDIKSHPFFKGINWPLIRSAAPPEIRNHPLPLGTKGAPVAKAAAQQQQLSVELLPPRIEFF